MGAAQDKIEIKEEIQEKADVIKKVINKCVEIDLYSNAQLKEAQDKVDKAREAINESRHKAAFAKYKSDENKDDLDKILNEYGIDLTEDEKKQWDKANKFDDEDNKLVKKKCKLFLAKKAVFDNWGPRDPEDKKDDDDEFKDDFDEDTDNLTLALWGAKDDFELDANEKKLWLKLRNWDKINYKLRYDAENKEYKEDNKKKKQCKDWENKQIERCKLKLPEIKIGGFPCSKNYSIDNFVLPTAVGVGSSLTDVKKDLRIRQSDAIYATPVKDLISIDPKTYNKYQNKLKSHNIFYTKK